MCETATYYILMAIFPYATARVKKPKLDKYSTHIPKKIVYWMLQKTLQINGTLEEVQAEPSESKAWKMHAKHQIVTIANIRRAIHFRGGRLIFVVNDFCDDWAFHPRNEPSVWFSLIKPMHETAPFNQITCLKKIQSLIHCIRSELTALTRAFGKLTVSLLASSVVCMTHRQNGHDLYHR